MYLCLYFIETPNDGGGDTNESRPINGEQELASIVQDQEMEEGLCYFTMLINICYTFCTCIRHFLVLSHLSVNLIY